MHSADLAAVWERADTTLRAAARELSQSLVAWLGRHATRRNLASFGVVLLAHLILLWALGRYLHFSHDRAPDRAFGVTLAPIARVAEAPAPPPTALEDPPIVAPPEIVIEDETALPGIAAASISMVLAPSPDPYHSNAPPKIAGFAGADGATILLKVLVNRNGAVDTAQIVSSSGQPDSDALAIAFVKANWRFLPAMLAGAPIPHWTTVSVAIEPAG